MSETWQYILRGKEQMNRRKFLSVFSLGAVSAPVLAMKTISEEPKTDQSMAPNDGHNLHLHRQKQIEQKNLDPNALYFAQYETVGSVELGVGQDDHLWIRPHKGEWKRLKTE
jgi:hypothetical protein